MTVFCALIGPIKKIGVVSLTSLSHVMVPPLSGGLIGLLGNDYTLENRLSH